MNECVYVVMRECGGHNRLAGVCATAENATRCVNILATRTYGLDAKAPLDFDVPWRYGWADVVWWEKVIVCD